MRRSAFLAGALLAASGCKNPSEPTPPSSRASAPPPVSESPATTGSLAPHSIEAPSACRVLEAAGDVHADAEPKAPIKALKRGELVDDGRWYTLAGGAHLTVKHSATGRELSLAGPARARLCRGGEEEVLLAAGELRTTANGGARPGAVVTIGTRAGIIQYGNAELLVRAAERRVEVDARAGDGWVLPAAFATRVGPEHVTAPRGRAILRLAADTSAERVVGACSEAAKHAASAAQAVLEPSASTSSLGERAAAQLRARQAARAACAIATAWLGAARDPAENGRLAASLAQAEALWQVVPSAPSR